MKMKSTGSYYTKISLRYSKRYSLSLGNLISLGESRVFCFSFFFFFFAIVSTRYQLNNCALNQNNTASFHERFDTTKINNILLQGNFDV